MCGHAGEFDPAGMKVFRAAYLEGRNLVVSADVTPGRSYERAVGSVTVRFAALADLAAELKAWAGRPMSRACGLMQSPGSTRIRGRITAIKNQIMVHIML